MARDPRAHDAADTSPSGDVSIQRSLSAFVTSLRPDQWTKNLIVFAGLIFGQRLMETEAVGAALWAFAVFCGLSSSMYVVNDLVDQDEDRHHPTKRRRPIAAGILSAGWALAGATLLGGVSLGVGFWISPAFGIVALVFVGLLTAYSQYLKHLVILDVLAIAIGFVIRAVGGAVAVGVPISQWLLVCTVLLALFLGLTKRASRDRLAGGLGARASAVARPVQLPTPGPAHFDRRRCNARKLRVLYGRTGYDREVRHRPAHLDAAVSDLWDLPLPLLGASARRRWKPGGDTSPRPSPPCVRRPLGRRYSTHHLLADGLVMRGESPER